MPAAPPTTPSVLLVAAKWWPLAARLALAFLRQGWQVASASHRGHPLRHVPGIHRHHRFGGPSSLATLRRALERESPTLVVPCDDGVVWQLHLLYDRHPHLRPLITRSLGPPETYPILRSRDQLLAVAATLGIRTPATRPIAPGADLSRVSPTRPAVLKVDGTCGGNGVQIARSPAEADAALNTLAQPCTPAQAWKQLLIDCDPIPLAEHRERRLPTVTLQDFIPGRPANAMLACWQGRLLGMVTVEVVTSHGATGAATVVRLVENPTIRTAAERLAAHLQLTGFHGLDFLLPNTTGEPLLIELNPRPTQLGHLSLATQGDLVSLFTAAATNQPSLPGPHPTPSLNLGDTIAFFPQALRLNPHSPYLASGHHDRPHGLPALERHLLRDPWPDRQPLARLYLRLRPRRQHPEVHFPSIHQPPANPED